MQEGVGGRSAVRGRCHGGGHRQEGLVGRRQDGLFGGGLGDERLQHADDGRQAAFDVGVLGFDGLLGSNDGLQLLVGLLGGELPDPPLEVLDGEFGPLSDGSLGLTVWGSQCVSLLTTVLAMHFRARRTVCPFLCQLLRRQVSHTSGPGGSLSFLGLRPAGGVGAGAHDGSGMMGASPIGGTSG